MKELTDEQLIALSRWERYTIEPVSTMQCCGNYLPTGECCTAQFGCGALVHGCEEQQVEVDPATAPDWEALAKELATRYSALLERKDAGEVGGLVERWTGGKSEQDAKGHYKSVEVVRASDYDALSLRLSEVEKERDALKASDPWFDGAHVKPRYPGVYVAKWADDIERETQFNGTGWFLDDEELELQPSPAWWKFCTAEQAKERQ